MHDNSFTFGGVDMYEQFGIMVLHYDVLLPQLRKRKVTIPKRHGTYDYGAKFYEDRSIRIECDSRTKLTKADIRELAYVLSKKAQLKFWNEPNLYYIGRIYDSSVLNYIGDIGHEFELLFECDPFAYGEIKGASISGSLRPNYKGTAPTPTRITITNVGAEAVSGIQIRIRERGDVY